MNIRDIIGKCVLCPGICSYGCPVYNTTRYRASAPVNIARAIYLSMNLNKELYSEAIGYCSLCNKCMEICPINNPLPDAIKALRRELTEPHVYSFEPEDFVIYMYRVNGSKREMEFNGVKYRLLQSPELYNPISYGYIDRIKLENSFNEDPDIFKGSYSIQLLKDIGYRYRIDGYILHIPCKVDDKIIGDYRVVFGGEYKIFRGCLGGGGLDILASKLLNRIRDRVSKPDIPIITQCGRAADRMRSWGLKAYTPMEVIMGDG